MAWGECDRLVEQCVEGDDGAEKSFTPLKELSVKGVGGGLCGVA